jgi:hypothetical protein
VAWRKDGVDFRDRGLVGVRFGASAYMVLEAGKYCRGNDQKGIYFGAFEGDSARIYSSRELENGCLDEVILGSIVVAALMAA